MHQRWCAAGFFIALATLTWQPVFLAVAAGAAVAALLGQRTGKLRALVGIAVGGIVPTVITVGAYAAIGKLQVFLDDFLLINAEYTQQTSLFDNGSAIWSFMVDAYGWSLWVLLGGMVVQLALAVAALARPGPAYATGGRRRWASASPSSSACSGR